MEQKNIREFGGTQYTKEEGAALIKELDDRTKSSEVGYNSISELAERVKAKDVSGIETNADAIDVLEAEQITQYEAIALNTSKTTNAEHTGDVTGDEALTISGGSITYSKIGNEFKTSSALTTEVNFSIAQVFTKTLSAATTLTFSNASIGMVKDLVITGDFALTLPTGLLVAGAYDGTKTNLIQIVVTGALQYWYSISQPQ